MLASMGASGVPIATRLFGRKICRQTKLAFVALAYKNRCFRSFLLIGNVGLLLKIKSMARSMV